VSLATIPDGNPQPPAITDPSQLPSSIPAYLIRVIPELRLNGVVITDFHSDKGVIGATIDALVFFRQ
jgi:hypothetical protein